MCKENIVARDLFDILDVPETATSAWIRRAYELRKQSITSDGALDTPRRQLELGALDEAYRVLSDDNQRTAYLNRLHPAPRPLLPASTLSMLLSPGMLAFYFVCLLSGLVYAYQHNQEQSRIRIEEDRIAAESARATKELENRAQLERERITRMAENERIRLEQQQRQQFDRERRNLDAWQRQAQFAARSEEQQRLYAERQQQYLAEQAERHDRMEREAEQRRAWAELDRQKRFLRESERR